MKAAIKKQKTFTEEETNLKRTGQRGEWRNCSISNKLGVSTNATMEGYGCILGMKLPQYKHSKSRGNTTDCDGTAQMEEKEASVAPQEKL